MSISVKMNELLIDAYGQAIEIVREGAGQIKKILPDLELIIVGYDSKSKDCPYIVYRINDKEFDLTNLIYRLRPDQELEKLIVELEATICNFLLIFEPLVESDIIIEKPIKIIVNFI